MPYPPGHSAQVKAKIVQSARRLFNRRGFDNVSIGQIMAGAGLTHGGFYSYFQSKSDLYAEVLGCFFTDPEWKSCWEGVEVDLSSSNVGPQVVRRLLVSAAFRGRGKFLSDGRAATDVSRCDQNAKRAFETVFHAMVSVLERSSIQNGRPRHITAQATAALCVGGMVVARAMLNRETADELREACMSVALKLGGWRAAPKSRKARSKTPRERPKASRASRSRRG